MTHMVHDVAQDKADLDASHVLLGKVDESNKINCNETLGRNRRSNERTLLYGTKKAFLLTEGFRVASLDEAIAEGGRK